MSLSEITPLLVTFLLQSLNLRHRGVLAAQAAHKNSNAKGVAGATPVAELLKNTKQLAAATLLSLAWELALRCLQVHPPRERPGGVPQALAQAARPSLWSLLSLGNTCPSSKCPLLLAPGRFLTSGTHAAYGGAYHSPPPACVSVAGKVLLELFVTRINWMVP
jgi:hypothetical protein